MAAQLLDEAESETAQLEGERDEEIHPCVAARFRSGSGRRNEACRDPEENAVERQNQTEMPRKVRELAVTAKYLPRRSLADAA